MKQKKDLSRWLPNLVMILVVIMMALIILRNERAAGEKLGNVYHDKSICEYKLDIMKRAQISDNVRFVDSYNCTWANKNITREDGIVTVHWVKTGCDGEQK